MFHRHWVFSRIDAIFLILSCLILVLPTQAPASSGTPSGLEATPRSSTAPLASLTYYVATNGSDLNPGTIAEPFATLVAARDAVRASGQDGATVYLRDGCYNLTSTLQLTGADSGAPGLNNVYTSYPNERATISGGIQLTGTWQKYNATLYSLDVGSLRFNSLFVNDTRAIRAREPDVGFYHIASVGSDNLVAFTFSGTDLNASWNDLRNVEVVSYRRWEQSRFKINSIVGQKVSFQGNLNTGRGYDWDFDIPHARYYAENVFEGLDQPREWYLDNTTGKLYYYPAPGEAVNKLTFVAPLLQQLVKVSNAQYVEFSNLTFANTDWSLPAGGYSGCQAACTLTTPEAFQFYYSTHCAFEHNTVEHTGGYGFGILGNYTHINYNELYDCGAGGIRLSYFGGGDAKYGVTHHNNVTWNQVHDNNQVNKEGIGIYVMISGYNIISFNTIYNMTYSGMSIGWSWDTTPSVAKANRIEGNHIHHVGLELNDLGGIYMLGNQTGTYVLNNTIHDVDLTPRHSWDYALIGLYIDEGGKGITAAGNLIYRTGSGMLIHHCHGNIIRDNIFLDSAKYAIWSNNNYPNEPGNTYIENVVYSNRTSTYLFAQGTWNNIGWCDNNTYYSTVPAPNSRWNLNWWKSQHPTFDHNSTLQDPVLVDYSADDFRVYGTSPAIDLGFSTEWLIKNDVPFINNNSLPNATEEMPYNVWINITDHYPIGGAVAKAMTTNASFLSYDPATGLLTGIPGNAEVGRYWVNFSASDARGLESFVNLTLEVLNVNDPPRITTENVTVCYEDSLYYVDYNATDIDPTNDNLTWRLETNASFLSLGANGTVSGTPNNDQVGAYWVKMNVTDGNGAFDEQEFWLIVLNTSPSINATNITAAHEDSPYYLDLNSTDDGLGHIKWNMVTDASGWLSLDRTLGTMRGTPANEDVGEYYVNITVTDGNGGSDWTNFTLTVQNVNDPPVCIVDYTDIAMDEDGVDQSIDLKGYFEDIDAGDVLSYTFDCSDNITATVGSDGIVTITPKANWSGSEALTVHANDTFAEAVSVISVKVRPQNDAPANASITLAAIKYVEGRYQPAWGNATDVDIPYGDVLEFTWSSNRSGGIGKGRSLNLSLPAGMHLVTLNVTDKHGAFCLATASVLVLAAPKNNTNVTPPDDDVDDDVDDDTDDDDDGGLSPGMMLAIGILLAVIVAAIVVVLYLRSKRSEPRPGPEEKEDEVEDDQEDKEEEKEKEEPGEADEGPKEDDMSGEPKETETPADKVPETEAPKTIEAPAQPAQAAKPEAASAAPAAETRTETETKAVVQEPAKKKPKTSSDTKPRKAKDKESSKSANGERKKKTKK